VIEINVKYMSLSVGDKIIATAWFSQHAAADGSGAWIVSTRPAPVLQPQPGHHGSNAR
jgi:hypothetical protein